MTENLKLMNLEYCYDHRCYWCKFYEECLEKAIKEMKGDK